MTMNMANDVERRNPLARPVVRAMRIEGDGTSFACHFFEIVSRVVVDAAEVC
jgi:hypothetical protein